MRTKRVRDRNHRSRTPAGYRFAPVREKTRLSRKHWWKSQSGYTRVWDDEYGRHAREASCTYADFPVAGRFVKVA
jgi:hypothetical protein